MSETNCLAPLGVVARFHTGWTPPTTDSRNFNGGLAWANISDIASQKVMSTAKTISEKALREQPNARLAHPGDVLFPFKLSLGASGIAGIPMYTNEAIATFPVADNPNFEPRYLYYVLPVFVPRNAAINIYGAPLLSSERIRSARIPMPSLQRQRAIADYLDRETTEIDGMRADLDEMERLLEERRSALIQRLIDQRIDADATPMSIAVTGHLGGSGLVGGQSSAGEGEIGILKTSAISSGKFLPSQNRLVEAEQVEKVPTEHFVKSGDVLFNRLNSPEYVGSMSYVGETQTNLIFSDKIWRLFPGPQTDPKYLALWAKTPAYRKQVEFSIVGTSQSMQSLGYSTFQKFRVFLPSLAEQRRIADEIDRETAEIDSMLEDITKLRDLLAERRAALISAAVTGQIDIPVSPTQKDEAHA